MEIVYKNKIYDVLKINGQWRVYSVAPNFTIKEAKAVIAKVRRLEKQIKPHRKAEG